VVRRLSLEGTRLRVSRSWWAIALLLALGIGRPVCAYTPQSPEVQQLLSKALTYLDERGDHDRLGGKALVGLAMLKGDRPVNHPRIQAAVAACQAATADIRDRRQPDVMYDLAIAIIFLCELDPDQYRDEIVSLTKVMMDWQKSFGGWGYLEGGHLNTGDSSMTQYAVLATWTVDRSGVLESSPEAVAKVCNWLLRTQDPSGGWGYQGTDPGTFDRVGQYPVQQSLSAAGLSSVYIAADLLQMTPARQRDPGRGLPPAVRRVQQAVAAGPRVPRTSAVDGELLKRAMTDGERWFAQNFRIDPEEWRYYFMYAFERYQSFRELASGDEPAEPEWYNLGVEALREQQDKDGSWEAEGGAVADTCFAILFLTRGTKKSIQKAEAYDGRLRGGRGLPTNTADVAVGEDGQIVKTPFQGQAESLLTLLESAADDDELLTRDIVVTLSDDPPQRARELERLRRLVAAEEFPVRMAALKALYSTRDLDNVPTFIYALGDPDPRIVAKARDALRLLSRKVSGFGLSDDPTEGAKLEAIEKWKQWYLAIRPNAQFLN
jgi:hypothetical protein